VKYFIIYKVSHFNIKVIFSKSAILKVFENALSFVTILNQQLIQH